VITVRAPILILGFVTVVVILTFTFPLTEAQMGYKVEVTVDNTTWSIERSTHPLTYQMDGKVSGTGMVMRDSFINNIAGVSAKETTHSLDENTTLISKEGPVVITGDIECANITTNESINITRNESVTITIHEAWPTFLSTAKDITYVGPGISTREEYENNGDEICTSFDVKGLTKTARFDTVLLGTIISAEVRPGCVNESICTNKSSYYTLSSISLGGSAHIGCRAGEGIGAVESSETYIGIFKIETAIKMEERIPPAPSNISSDWMLCPSSSEP
jgi:hypothetical protein